MLDLIGLYPLCLENNKSGREITIRKLSPTHTHTHIKRGVEKRVSLSFFGMDVSFYYNKNNNYYVRCGVYDIVCRWPNIVMLSVRSMIHRNVYDRSNHGSTVGHDNDASRRK